MAILRSHSPRETFQLGERLSKKLRGGEVIALSGELGAGKTTLTKGIAAGLGIRRTITSPTFLLLRVYPVRGHHTIRRFVHVDAYRVKHPAELLDIGLREYLGQPDAVVAIEWADHLGRILPARHTRITLILGRRQSTRCLTLRRNGLTRQR